MKTNTTKKANQLTRRKFISTSGLALAAMLVTPLTMNAQNNKPKIKAIAFDGFVIFDPKPVQETLNRLLPEKATEFGTIWRTKQFEYTWLRTASGKYKNFWGVTQDALEYTIKKIGVTLSENDKKQLMQKFLELNVWPEVVEGLKTLRLKGYRLAFLSNFTKEMILANVTKNNIDPYFNYYLTTDTVSAFKPSPLAYQLGIDAFHLNKEEILFAAYGAWDATGAKAFGYPTFWVNRQQIPLEELDAAPEGTGHDFKDLLNFLENK